MPIASPSARKVRVRMDIKLYEDGRVVLRTTKYLRTRVMATVTAVSAPKWTYGTLTVWYSKKHDYWNAGQFEDSETLQELLTEYLEWPLVRDFVDMDELGPEAQAERRKAYAWLGEGGV